MGETTRGVERLFPEDRKCESYAPSFFTPRWLCRARAFGRDFILVGFVGNSRRANVGPAAPTGGSVRQGALGTYDNFNLIVTDLKENLADQSSR